MNYQGLKGKLEIAFCIVVGNVSYNFGQGIHVRGELTVFYPGADQVAEDAAEVLMSGVGKEAS